MTKERKVVIVLPHSEATDLLHKIRRGEYNDETRETLKERLWEALHESSFQAEA